MHNHKRSALFVCALSAMLLFAWTTEAEAQRRRAVPRRVARPAVTEAGEQRHRAVPRRVTRPAVRVNTGFVYRPFFYGGFYSPYYYRPYYRPYGYYYGPYAGAYYEPTGALRVQVKPEATEVWVDGYFAGVADSFDGFFQRLRLPPGEYDIELRLDGYRSLRERVLLSPGSTLKIQHLMEPLEPGETTPPPPEPTAREIMPPDPSAYPPERPAYPPERRVPPPGPRVERGAPLSPAAPDFGTLALRIQPLDAEVLIDGERWRGPAGSDRLVVELGPGVYPLEIRRDGYRTFVADVEVIAGETTVINVGLPPLEPENR